MRNNSKANPKLVLPLADRDHMRGPVDAPLTLVEYGDFECPYCGEAYSVVKAIQERVGDQVCFAFRNFPLANAHPHAEHAAEAAEAAGTQGRFWEMHAVLFEHQEALEDEDLRDYALMLGLDAVRLIREVTSNTHASRLREDVLSGRHNDVQGTPAFFVNGLRFDEEHTEENLFQALTANR